MSLMTTASKFRFYAFTGKYYHLHDNFVKREDNLNTIMPFYFTMYIRSGRYYIRTCLRGTIALQIGSLNG